MVPGASEGKIHLLQALVASKFIAKIEVSYIYIYIYSLINIMLLI